MYMSRGFTVVELLITLAVMAILLGLGVVSMRSMIANANDNERASDIATIARGLEIYYKKGNPHVKTYEQDPVGGMTTKGMYPGANEFTHIQGQDWCSHSTLSVTFTPCFVPGGYANEVFPGVSLAAMTPPGKTIPDLRSTWFMDDTQMQAALDDNAYVYKPLTSDGSNCYGGAAYGTVYACPSYELRYKKESDGQIVLIKSKHR